MANYKRENNGWKMTAEVYEEIRNTIGIRKPENGGILGSSDGVHIDHYHFDSTADRTSASYTMDAPALNKVIHEWNDNGIRLIGVIHSHPTGCTRPSEGDRYTAAHLIDIMDVEGKFFTPIVQVSPKLNGDIKIYPYTFEREVHVKNEAFAIEKPENQRSKDKTYADRAPKKFDRIKGILPENVMSQKLVICIGCGGSREYLEALARCGVGNFVLIDKDRVEDTNIATQATYIDELGEYKTEVIKKKIYNINPLANVKCINAFLDKDMSDEKFASLTDIRKFENKDVLICGCTDNFFAQDRCAQLSLKYRVPYLAAQIYANGKGHEVIFWYPDVTPSCPRCMLKTRYEKMLDKSFKSTGSSAGTAVFITNYLNAIKGYTSLALLCYDDKQTKYYHSLDKYANKNFFMTRCNDELKAPALDGLDNLESTQTNALFPFVTVAIEQEQESDCPLCKGEKNSIRISNLITDTRNI